MQNEKNKLVTLTPEQASPGLADPRSFKIAPEVLEGGGQCGDNEKEYDRLLAEHEESPKGLSNIQSRIEKELARERRGSRQPGE